MAGNALTAAMFSVGKGNTGVGKPTETLSAIDKGIKDVGTWASGIEAEKQKLKTDTAKKYREAELKAYENMPSNETEKANMIKGLASYKDQLYMNMKLVQNGNIDSKDNLIFQENGKQSFDILSQVIKSYGEERDLTMKRARGYTAEDGTVVPPTSGGVEGALQDLQTRLGNPQFSKITFDEKGMGAITFFETEIDKETDTRVIKRDSKGEPIVQKGMGSLSVLAYEKGRNQRAERVYLDREAQAFIGKETALGQAYQIMEGINKGMAGNVTDDQRQKSKNQLDQLLDQAASAITSSNDRVASILVDNGTLAERSIAINQIQAEEGKVDLNEKISYTYIDSSGKTQTGQKSKYILQKVSQNNQIVSVLSDEDKQAAVNISKSQLYSQLGREVKGGTKVTTFDPNTPQKLSNKTQVDEGVRTIASLNNLRGAKTPEEMELSLQELQGLSGLRYGSIKENTSIITGPDGKDKEIVTSVSFNLNGKDVAMEFGTVATENGKKVFKETSGEDFVMSNYKYINPGGVSSDIALSNFKKKGNTIFDNVSQTGSGTRNKTYGSTKELSLTQTYKVGEDKTTLKEQLQTVFQNADDVSSLDLGQDMDNLVGGVKETMLSAYGALGLDVPKGFDVKNDGNDLIIQAQDSEGITVIKKVKKIGNASNQGYQELQGAVAEFITKIK